MPNYHAYEINNWKEDFLFVMAAACASLSRVLVGTVIHSKSFSELEVRNTALKSASLTFIIGSAQSDCRYCCRWQNLFC